MITKMTVSEKKYPLTLTREETNHPLAKYYNQVATVSDEIIAEIKLKPQEGGVKFENINDVLNSESSGFETGYTVLEDNVGYVAVNTQFPGATPEMLDWWFDWVGYDPVRYKIWYPGNHSQALYEEKAHTPGGKYSILTEVVGTENGKIKHTLEAMAIGDKIRNLYITFVDPVKFGLDSSKLGDDQWAIPAEVRNGPLLVTRMVHFVRKTENGVEMRSRFWMGEPLPKFLRGIAANEQQLIDMSNHCAKEYTQLASFLPEVYAIYGNQTE